MSDLNQNFLNEYIRLEKLCKELYKDLPREELRGVWNYTQDMKNTPPYISKNIPDWNYHLRELERIRRTKNNWSHQVDGTKLMPFTKDDIKYLKSFRQSILDGSDPLSLSRKAAKKSKNSKRITTQTYVYNTNRNYKNTPKKAKASFPSVLFWALFTLGVAVAFIYFLSEIFSSIS